MKVIDLLNKIANGEEVPKFWWNGCIHEVEKEYGTNKYSIFDTYCKKYKRIELEDLNEEIKFLEEEPYIEMCGRWFTKSEYDEFVQSEEENKIPEKLGECAYVDGEIAYSWSKSEAILKTRINEIIDYLKSKGE